MRFVSITGDLSLTVPPPSQIVVSLDSSQPAPAPTPPPPPPGGRGVRSN